MTNLQMRQTKIQEKRKKTPFREFVMEICSRRSLNFYKNHNNISIFPQNERSGRICSIKEYNNIYSNNLNNNETYNEPFLDSMKRLFISYIKPPVHHVWTNEWCEYSNTCFGSKNAYLSFVSWYSAENIVYSTQTRQNVTNVYNSSLVTNGSSNIYQSKVITNSYNVFYSQYIYNSNNIRFCSNCINCSFCIECDGLENKSYYIKNKSYSKEDYNKIRQTYQKEDFINIYNHILTNKWKNYLSNNSSWSWLYQCEAIENWFNVIKYTNGRNVLFSDSLNGWRNFFDCIDTWTNSNDFYGICQWWEDSNQCYLSNFVSTWCSNLYYCIHMESCSFCLWCIGLKNRTYCIFNTQYTKEERYEKVDEIFTQMERDWQLWQFFSATMNPFYFNDTAAYLIDPSFTKEEVIAKWYLRRDEPIKVDIPEGMEVVMTNELWSYEWFDNEWNRIINADILKKVIQDEEWNVYRIIPMEYKFLVKHGLPLPRKHRLERMKENFKIN